MLIENVAESLTDFDIPIELDILDGASRSVAAQIRRVSPSQFELSSPELLGLGQRLALLCEGHRLEVEVSATSEQTAGPYMLTVKVVADDLGEVRSELRLPTDLPAKLRVAASPGELAVRVVDMSPSGMGLEIPAPLLAGTKVCVDLEQGLAFGEIRFCRQKSPNLYSVGFRLVEYIAQQTRE